MSREARRWTACPAARSPVVRIGTFSGAPENFQARPFRRTGCGRRRNQTETFWKTTSGKPAQNPVMEAHTGQAESAYASGRTEAAWKPPQLKRRGRRDGGAAPPQGGSLGGVGQDTVPMRTPWWSSHRFLAELGEQARATDGRLGFVGLGALDATPRAAPRRSSKQEAHA